MGTCKLLCRGKKKQFLPTSEQWRKLGVAQIAPVLDASNRMLKSALNDSEFSATRGLNSFPEREVQFVTGSQSLERMAFGSYTLDHRSGDQPQIEISTLRCCSSASQQNPTRICQPVFCNVAAIADLPKHHFLSWPKATQKTPHVCSQSRAVTAADSGEDPSVTADLDTQEEYAQLA